MMAADAVLMRCMDIASISIVIGLCGGDGLPLERQSDERSWFLFWVFEEALHGLVSKEK